MRKSYKSKNSIYEIKRKKIETCIKNYNVENPSQSKEIQDRIKHNNLKRYGVESTNSLLEVKNKKIPTCLKHFNCEYPGQCEDVQKKIKQTKIDKYGDPNYTNFEKTAVFAAVFPVCWSFDGDGEADGRYRLPGFRFPPNVDFAEGRPAPCSPRFIRLT